MTWHSRRREPAAGAVSIERRPPHGEENTRALQQVPLHLHVLRMIWSKGKKAVGKCAAIGVALSFIYAPLCRGGVIIDDFTAGKTTVNCEDTPGNSSVFIFEQSGLDQERVWSGSRLVAVDMIALDGPMPGEFAKVDISESDRGTWRYSANVASEVISLGSGLSDENRLGLSGEDVAIEVEIGETNSYGGIRTWVTLRDVETNKADLFSRLPVDTNTSFRFVLGEIASGIDISRISSLTVAFSTFDFQEPGSTYSLSLERIAVVPEPGLILSIMAGLVGFAGWRSLRWS